MKKVKTSLCMKYANYIMGRVYLQHFALVGMYQKSHLFTALTLDYWYITNSGENALCMPFLEVIYTLCLYHLGKSQSHSVCCL